jgi:hypothetical protein
MQEELPEKEELEVIAEDEEGGEVEEQKEELKAEDQAESKDDDDELENYSESVQRRIRKLTSKYREEERQRQAAIEYAEAVKKQNDELQHRLTKLDESYVGEFGTRLESQVIAAKEAYRKAHDEGDVDAMFEAQENISRLALERSRYDHIKQVSEAAPARQQAPQEVPAQAPQRAAPARPDPKAEAWAEKNNWFGQDQTMTYAAFGIHRQLIEDEGFDPTSDEYYTELDRRVRVEFPHKFQNGAEQLN